MEEWVEYDGTNKPHKDSLVRVKFPDGWESEPDDWLKADLLYWDVGKSDDHISHFIVKESA